MKQAMTLLLTFLFCCSLLSCNINQRFIVVKNEEPEKTLTVSSAKELVDFLNGYLFLDRETGETPPQYLLGKDFSFDVLYTKFNAQTDLDGLSFYGEILPYSFRFVHKGNSLYSRYISTCYGYYNSPTCAFRQTETSEYYRDFASLTSFCSILHEEQRFRTYGDFDETQITYDQKNKVYLFERKRISFRHLQCRRG